jgi:pimeloyl-ACP methyl ester carboxylesterase
LTELSGTNRSTSGRASPAFYLVATQDGMIPPPAQRMMAERAGATVREEAGSHAIYVSKPVCGELLICVENQ